MNIERLCWWQIEDLVPIEKELFGVEAWTAAMFWNELATGHHYVAAIEDDGAVLGYAGLALGQEEAWINNLAVRRDAQGRGIGRALLDALLVEARRNDVKQVLLEVGSENEVAQRLYDSYGFESIGLRRGYYQPSNTDALIMRLELDNG